MLHKFSRFLKVFFFKKKSLCCSCSNNTSNSEMQRTRVISLFYFIFFIKAKWEIMKAGYAPWVFRDCFELFIQEIFLRNIHFSYQLSYRRNLSINLNRNLKTTEKKDKWNQTIFPLLKSKKKKNSRAQLIELLITFKTRQTLIEKTVKNVQTFRVKV